MIMRKRPIRGEQYVLPGTADKITILQEKGKDRVEAIMPNGKITLLLKAELGLPTINTMAYEKVHAS